MLPSRYSVSSWKQQERKLIFDAEKIAPKHRTAGCSVCVYVCVRVRKRVCVHRAYGVCCTGRLWAEMRREFLSCCVMFIHPQGDGGFLCNKHEAEGNKANL